MGKKRQLKFVVSLRDLRQLPWQPWLRKYLRGPPRREKLISVYYDTSKFKLRDHGVTLRVRKQGHKQVQTIKILADGGEDSFGRQKWEEEITGQKPNYKIADGTALAPLFTPGLKRAVRAMFETKVERTTLLVSVGHSLVEVVLDHGLIQAGRHREAISEIELALKKGKPGDLVWLARQFARHLPVSYGIGSKAERGYALSAGEGNRPAGAVSIKLPHKASAAEAFSIIGLSCLDHLVRNRQAVREGVPEGVHQMRVGLRRLRAAISVFKEFVQGPEAERIKADLTWLTERLGPARDLDVLIADGLALLQREYPGEPSIASLKSDLNAQRLRDFSTAKAAVESDRYRKMVVQVLLWLIGGKWLQTTDPLMVKLRGRRIADFAASIMEQRSKTVVKRAAKLRSLDARRLHKLRIAAKKLRYAAEFFESLFGKGKAQADRKEFLESLKRLQDALGQLNDTAVQEKVAQKYTYGKARGKKRGEQAAGVFAMGMLTIQEHDMAKAAMTRAIRASKHLMKMPHYWRQTE